MTNSKQLTPALRRRLAAKALAMVERAYAPYSRFRVGAAVLAASGRIYGGANVENASYGATVCAERNAVAAAVNAGERVIRAIAVCGGRSGRITEFCPPCGLCRQVLREFCRPDECEVLLVRSRSEFRALPLAELLPESFGPDSL